MRRTWPGRQAELVPEENGGAAVSERKRLERRRGARGEGRKRPAWLFAMLLLPAAARTWRLARDSDDAKLREEDGGSGPADWTGMEGEGDQGRLAAGSGRTRLRPDRWMDGSKGLGSLGAENQEGGRATRMDRARSRGRVDEVEKLVGGGARRIGWIGRARARVRLILYSR